MTSIFKGFNSTDFTYWQALKQHTIAFGTGYSFATDLKFWLELVKVGKVINLPQILTKYRVHSHQAGTLHILESRRAGEIVSQKFSSFLFDQVRDNGEFSTLLKEQLQPLLIKIVILISIQMIQF